jgi:flagellar motor protein MotB
MRKTKTIVVIILGILGIVTSVVPIIGILFAGFGLALGVRSTNFTKQEEGTAAETGIGLKKLGVILSAVGLIITAIVGTSAIGRPSLEEYNTAIANYNNLSAETEGWRKLSGEEKAAKEANAKAERIKAEDAFKKEQERKIAAEIAQKAKEEEEKTKLKAEQKKKEAAEKVIREAEEKVQYNTGITFNQLARNPSDYKEKKVKFYGRVIQVIEGGESGSEVNLRVAVKRSKSGNYFDDVILVYYSESIVKSRILEDDMITFYGVSKGLHTYESTMGGNITVPLVQVDKIKN